MVSVTKLRIVVSLGAVVIRSRQLRVTIKSRRKTSQGMLVGVGTNERMAGIQMH